MAQNNLGTYGVICLNALICLLTMFYRLVGSDANLDQLLIVQSVSFLSLIVFHSYSWFKQGGSDLSLAYLFFLMVFIFNGGKALLFLFYQGYEEPFFTFFGENDYQLVVRAFEYSYVGMFVMSSAMLLNMNEAPAKNTPANENQTLAAKVTGILFLAVSLPAAIYDLQSMLMKVISGGYFALFSSEQDFGASGIVKVLGFFLFPAFYITLIAFRENKLVIYCVWILAAIFTVAKLAMGARLVALVPFLIMLSLWDVTVKQVGRKIIYLSGIGMVAVVFPALSLLRVGEELDDKGGITDSIFTIIKEMSDSMSPLVWVMQRVPSKMDFQYGDSFLLATSTAIPNLFWDAHPAQRGSLALWLAREVDPWIAKQGGGFGFSIFAEFYLNFYWFGMIILFITTILISKLAKVRENPINTAFCFGCFLGLMLWPRGELVAVARFILWNVGIPWLCYQFLVSVFSRYNKEK
jgi:oligosaccharide repeat unit polymerase